MEAKNYLRNNALPISVAQLKRYVYGAAAVFGALSMLTELGFGSPTQALSPSIVAFDRIVFPAIMVVIVVVGYAIRSGRVSMQRVEELTAIAAAIFFVSKFGIVLFTTPTTVSLAFTESWYWMLIAAWTFAFLAFEFKKALVLNAIVYSSMLAIHVSNMWIKLAPDAFFDQLPDIVASHCRLLATLTFIIVLGQIKQQWVLVEREVLMLRDIAHIDSLTNVPNRRGLQDAFARATFDSSGPICIILFDLDGFKRVNDQYGHNAGDEVLKRVAASALTCVTADATVGRWGGEEFLVICPGARLSEGVQTAERLRQAIAVKDTQEAQYLTASFGVVERQDGESLQQLVAQADTALYAAKEDGKNRVRAYRHGTITHPPHFSPPFVQR